MFIDKGKGRAVDPPEPYRPLSPVPYRPVSPVHSSPLSIASVFGGHGEPVAPRKQVEETSEEPEDEYVYTPWTAKQKEEAKYTKLANSLDRKYKEKVRAEYEAQQKKKAEAHKAKKQAAGETERQKEARRQEEEAKKNLEEMNAKSRQLLRKLQKRPGYPYPIQTSVSVLL